MLIESILNPTTKAEDTLDNFPQNKDQKYQTMGSKMFLKQKIKVDIFKFSYDDQHLQRIILRDSYKILVAKLASLKSFFIANFTSDMELNKKNIPKQYSKNQLQILNLIMEKIFINLKNISIIITQEFQIHADQYINDTMPVISDFQHSNEINELTQIFIDNVNSIKKMHTYFLKSFDFYFNIIRYNRTYKFLKQQWDELSQDISTCRFCIHDYLGKVQIYEKNLNYKNMINQIKLSIQQSDCKKKINNKIFINETKTERKASNEILNKYKFPSNQKKQNMGKNIESTSFRDQIGEESRQQFIQNILKNKQLFEQNIQKAQNFVIKHSKNFI